MSKEFDKFCNENWPNGEYHQMDTCHNALKIGWDACKQEILEMLNENKELEAISQNGKKVYKIYGNVIKKIEKL